MCFKQAVFTEAVRTGLDACLDALNEADAWTAIRLTVLTLRKARVFMA